MDEPFTIIVALALGAIAVFVILNEVLQGSKRRRSNRHDFRPNYQRSKFSQPISRAPVTPIKLEPTKDHLDLVRDARFSLVPLHNKSETRILYMLERIVGELGDRHRLLSQVALGELLCAQDDDGGLDRNNEANRAISAKRLDFAIVNRRGLMVAAIEYQGSGHHLGSSAFLRDAVKREALRKAGITLIELPADADENLLRSRLAESGLIAPRATAPQP